MNIENNIMNKNLKNLNNNDVELIPTGRNVLFTIYPENPYRKMEISEEGVVFGIESSKTYKSNETGEIEKNEEAIICAKIQAVGSKCQDAKVGDDVYLYTTFATPVPFRNKHLFMVDEMNILCLIRNKNDV